MLKVKDQNLLFLKSLILQFGKTFKQITNKIIISKSFISVLLNHLLF